MNKTLLVILAMTQCRLRGRCSVYIALDYILGHSIYSSIWSDIWTNVNKNLFINIMYLSWVWHKIRLLYLNTKYMTEMYWNTKYMTEMYWNTKYIFEIYLRTKYMTEMYLPYQLPYIVYLQSYYHSCAYILFCNVIGSGYVTKRQGQEYSL